MQQNRLCALRETLALYYRPDENDLMADMLSRFKFSKAELESINTLATELVTSVRAARLGKGGIDAFLYQYDLSSEEGIALMCLAEGLLRIPDAKTSDLLIREKLSGANWRSNVGESDSLFVNAATWGLILTGKVLSDKKDRPNLNRVLGRLVERVGEPVIRHAIAEAMKILGKQFILGRDIDEALTRGKKRAAQGYTFSYDMLGEAARTASDAARYFADYERAIHAIGQFANSAGPVKGPGISIKLSALYPRYEYLKREDAIQALTASLLQLALLAKQYDIGLTVDAEEAGRLEMSLDIIEAVFTNEQLAGWQGFGLAVQAYQKRAPFVIDWLIELARTTGRQLMVRLVKGAYWDTEIKNSQVQGLLSYPVYTRKVNTDVSYLYCAKKLIAAPDAIYPQFATHNAQSLAAIVTMMPAGQTFEFQCLQGMGHALYDEVVAGYGFPCRVYAPCGSHEDLLPYLVRRLLENGANTSFVNRLVDEKTPISDLVADPVAACRALENKSHPQIPLPLAIFGDGRQNSLGFDFTDGLLLRQLQLSLASFDDHLWTINQLQGESVLVNEPQQRDKKVGTIKTADADDVEQAIAAAEQSFFSWNSTPVAERSACLQRAADLLEAQYEELIALAIRESGKTMLDAMAEIREAVDFCRYYAVEANRLLATQIMPGPTGERNELQLQGRGVFACISPWNFPLAIFMGQACAALVTGNCVVAKPADQTPLIAAKAVALLHAAGVPKAVLQLLPGQGAVVGETLVKDPRIKGVVFTGSTATAKIINQNLAAREGAIIPFIAETGGQNAMIVDSSALPEQLVVDVIESAFYSAGQRCSALRVLFLQSEIADKVKVMLAGAMAELTVGDPRELTTDVGPIIDQAALARLEAHEQYLTEQAQLIYKVPETETCRLGTFFTPCAYEISSLKQLTHEVFGPILHVITYEREHLQQVIDDINATDFGLTLGIHSRIEANIDMIRQRVRVGNIYVNRNMVGAVVGVQPFGGEGLSGTGPKAGGPHYLPRFCSEVTLSVDTTATGGNASLLSLAS